MDQIFKNYTQIIHVEDGTVLGGAGSALLEYAHSCGYTAAVECLGIQDGFVSQGSVEKLYQTQGLSVDQLRERFENLG